MSWKVYGYNPRTKAHVTVTTPSEKVARDLYETLHPPMGIEEQADEK